MEVFCKCHGRRLGTGLATAVSINNQPRLDATARSRSARFCIFSRNHAGKLWLLTLAHTPYATYFRLKNNEQTRNSIFLTRILVNFHLIFPWLLVVWNVFIESERVDIRYNIIFGRSIKRKFLKSVGRIRDYWKNTYVHCFEERDIFKECCVTPKQ